MNLIYFNYKVNEKEIIVLIFKEVSFVKFKSKTKNYKVKFSFLCSFGVSIKRDFLLIFLNFKFGIFFPNLHFARFAVEF